MLKTATKVRMKGTMYRTARFLGFPLTLGVAAKDAKISEKNARELVHKALLAQRRTVPSTQIRRIDVDSASEFYNFEAFVGQSGNQPLLTYYYSVNARHGEVWDCMDCSRITSPILREEHEAIWKRSGLLPEA